MQGQIIVDFQILENLWYIAANYEQIELLFFHHNFCFKGVETSPLKIQSEEISCFFASSVFAFLFCSFYLPVCRVNPIKEKLLPFGENSESYVFIIFLISILSTIFSFVQSDMVLTFLRCRFTRRKKGKNFRVVLILLFSVVKATFFSCNLVMKMKRDHLLFFFFILFYFEKNKNTSRNHYHYWLERWKLQDINNKVRS